MEQIFANDGTDKRLVFKIYKSSYNNIKKPQTNQKMGKISKYTFSEEDI